MDKYINNKYYKSDITGKVIGCAQKVHRFLGNGFQEVIYQRALEIEFSKEDLKFEREKEMDIFYEDALIGNRRVDFLVDRDIMVELKAITKLEDVNVAQLINYIEAYKVRIGLLINFGAKSLEVRRYIK
ncbi:MAG: GxxExxY protein [Candidatus Moranbacteria bacterium RIFOXYA12_FULL_44_15]|nr:MAG: GxxExxY protein [Candidatus Moranbacteria bacterium RIFOXYA12_FULL_44_15]OGI36085.1 MAG: GxxExxY protein [Candidatus Moranbacteria bacterium RIFOXYA2_FULL_43_15]